MTRSHLYGRTRHLKLLLPVCCPNKRWDERRMINNKWAEFEVFYQIPPTFM